MLKHLALLVPVALMGAGCSNPDRPKPPMKCDAEWKWDSRDFSTKITATKYGSLELGTSKQAIRDVDTRVQHYSTEWGKLCREWNGGVVEKADFNRRSEAIGAKMGRLDELLMILENAPSEAAYLEGLRLAYNAMVQEDKQLDLEVKLAVRAKRPSDADYAVVAPNAALPTGTKVQLTVISTVPAHLYIYQVDAKGAIVPLFPDSRIPLSNPIPGGAELRIPNGQASFTLNEEDIGTEHIHVVASAKPMPELQASLGKANNEPAAATAQQLDCAGARGLAYDSGECPSSRGLVYDDGGGGSGYSVMAVNAAADDAVHVVYSFEHTAS